MDCTVFSVFIYSRWMAYSRKHLEHPLDYQLLLSLLQELDDLWEPTSLSREEVSLMRY